MRSAEATRTVCPFCAMGCTLLLSRSRESACHGETDVPALDYDAEGAINRGSLCARGNMALEMLAHPRRFGSPWLRRDGRAVRATWEEALAFLAERIERIRLEAGDGAVGILVGPELTIEEARLAAALARHLGTRSLDGGLPEDRLTLRGLDLAPGRPRPVASVEEIDAMTAMLVVGDLFTLAPCVSRSVLRARYDRRRNLLGVLDSAVHRTGWFAKPMLRCRPGRETAALAVLLDLALRSAPDLPWVASIRETIDRAGREEIRRLAGLPEDAAAWLVEALRAEPETGVLVASSFGGTERPDLAAGLAAALAEATGSRFLVMTAGPDAAGVSSVLREGGFPGPEGLTADEMMEAAVTGELKALLVLGGDPVGVGPGSLAREAAEQLDLLAVSATLPNETTEAAHVVLPAQAWGEKPGTVRNAFGGEAALGTAMAPPGAARPDGEILEALLARLSKTRGANGREAGGAPPPAGDRFGDEVDLHFRVGGREPERAPAGTHVLLPRSLPAHAGDGSLTRHLSWPRHESPDILVSLAPAHARELGVSAGDPVLVRSRQGEAVLRVRIEARVPAGTVLVPPHHPEVRRLFRWRLDDALRVLDLRPGRATVERVTEARDG